ncbi:MAG: RHS repeat-associated core domain-containing protein, partial [Myxococcota bacterium]
LGGLRSATYTNFDLPRTIGPSGWSTQPTLTYAYDGFEQQVGHTSSNGDVEVRLGDLLERHVVGGTTSMLYAVYAEGERVAEIEATPGNKFNPVVYTTRAIVNDRQGTSLASVEGSTVTQGPILEPFGMTMSGSTEDQRFASHAFDATGYVNARGRYYDPATANFMTTDPVRVPTAEHMNLYGYAAADPSNRTDPTGFFPDDGPIGGGAPTTPPATPSGGGGGDLPPMRDPGPGAGAPTGGAQRIRQTNASAQNRANRRRQPRRGRRSRDETAHESQDRRGGVITLVFPGFPTDTETELGRIAAIHAAFVAVQPNGRVRYFEYGRYGGPRGRVRERTIPFRLRFNSDGEPTDRSMRRLLRLVSRRYGRGASVRGEFFSDADPDAAIRYALHRQRDRDRRDYSLIDNTCVEFVVGALDASMSLFDRIVAWPTFYYLTGNTIDYGDDSL